MTKTKTKSLNFAVGDVVKSRINTTYKGTYTIVQTKTTVCWLKLNLDEPKNSRSNSGIKLTDIIYKGIPYRILEKVS